MEEASRTSTNAAVTAKTVEAMEKLKLTLKKRGTHGIITLGRKFKAMDDDNSGSLGEVFENNLVLKVGFRLRRISKGNGGNAI